MTLVGQSLRWRLHRRPSVRKRPLPRRSEKAAAKEVVDDARVRGGDAPAEAQHAAHLDGGGRGGREQVGGPVVEAVEVADEGHQVAEHGVRVAAVVAVPRSRGRGARGPGREGRRR